MTDPAGRDRTSGSGTDVFTPDVVAAITRHMNEDHAEDTLLIVRAHTSAGEATAARMTDVDADGGEYVASVDGGDVTVRVPWSQRLTERPQVRRAVVRLYEEACARLGVEPRH